MSDEKYRIRGWQTQALNAAVALMQAKAKISESVEALERLGLDHESYDFQRHLNGGKAYRCATEACETICFAPDWGDDKEPLRCEPHEKAHTEQVSVKRDADLEKGLAS